MRHMLITVPVLILLSVAACGEGTTTRDGVTTTQDGREERQVGNILEGRDLDSMIQDGHRDQFSREANRALDDAERDLQVIRTSPDTERRDGVMTGEQRDGVVSDDPQRRDAQHQDPQHAQRAQAIESLITNTRQDLQRLDQAPEQEWQLLGQDIRDSLQRIDQEMSDLAG